MPFYDYRCKACGYKFEIFQSMKDEPISQCPKCGKTEAKRIIAGVTGIIFKGSGFYANDNKKSPKNSSETGPEKKEPINK